MITNAGPARHNALHHDVKTKCLECPSSDCNNHCAIWWDDFKKHIRQFHPDFRVLPTDSYMQYNLPPFVQLFKCQYCRYAHYKESMVKIHRQNKCEQRSLLAKAGRLSDGLATRASDAPFPGPLPGSISAKIPATPRDSDESPDVIVEEEEDAGAGLPLDMGALSAALVQVTPATVQKTGLTLSQVAQSWLEYYTRKPPTRLVQIEELSQENARERDTKSCMEHIKLQKRNVALARSALETLQSQLQVKPHLPAYPGVEHEVNAMAFLRHRSPTRPEEWFSVRMALNAVPAPGSYLLYQGSARIDDITVELHARNDTDPSPPIDIIDQFVCSKMVGTIYSCNGPWVLRSRIRMTERLDKGNYTMVRQFHESREILVTFMGAKEWQFK